MARIAYAEKGDSPLQRLLGHNPEVLKNWDQLLASFYQFSSFDKELQEEVRRAVAYQVGCAYCMSHGCPSPHVADKKTKTAVDFARKVSDTSRPITDDDIALLKKYFSDKEIGELCAFISFGLGYARFGNILGVDVVLP